MNKTENKEELLKKNADDLGLEATLIQTIEEMAELIKAICKYFRYGNSKLNDVIEELSDVSITSEQLKYLIDCNDIVDEITMEKLIRTKERIEKTGGNYEYTE